MIGLSDGSDCNPAAMPPSPTPHPRQGSGLRPPCTAPGSGLSAVARVRCPSQGD